MTLVIARHIGDEIRLISETKVTDAGVLHQTPLQGVLKSIVLSSTCCISFAGNVYIAERILGPLLQTTILSRTELTSHLLEQHREHDRQTDFIIATAGKVVSVDRISNGCLEEDLPSAWIGDAEAFATYQANYHASLEQRSPLFDERFRIASAMSDGLRAVVDDLRIESVGDFTVSVTSRPVQEDGFRYLSSTFASGFKTSLTQRKKLFSLKLWASKGEAIATAYSHLLHRALVRSLCMFEKGVACFSILLEVGVLFCSEMSTHSRLLKKSAHALGSLSMD